MGGDLEEVVDGVVFPVIPRLPDGEKGLPQSRHCLFPWVFRELGHGVRDAGREGCLGRAQIFMDAEEVEEEGADGLAVRLVGLGEQGTERDIRKMISKLLDPAKNVDASYGSKNIDGEKKQNKRSHSLFRQSNPQQGDHAGKVGGVGLKQCLLGVLQLLREGRPFLQGGLVLVPLREVIKRMRILLIQGGCAHFRGRKFRGKFVEGDAWEGEPLALWGHNLGGVIWFGNIFPGRTFSEHTYPDPLVVEELLVGNFLLGRGLSASVDLGEVGSHPVLCGADLGVVKVDQLLPPLD